MGQRYQSLHVHSHASCFHGEFDKLMIVIENEKQIKIIIGFQHRLVIEMMFTFLAVFIPMLDRNVQLIHPTNKKNRSCG